MSDEIFDVAIVGAGPVGSVLALALAARNMDVALIDARENTASKQRDTRNFAIVTGSWRLLESVGVAASLAESSQPLHGLEAVDGGTHWFGRPAVKFTDSDLDSFDPNETLGHMVMAEALQGELDKAVAASSAIKAIRPARFASMTCEDEVATVELADGQILKARLVVGGDGMKSAVREALGITTEGRDYGKSVFTANVKLSEPHNGIARQLFTPQGPFATLPLTNQRANLAWYMKRGAAETLASRPVAEAEAELNDRFADFAGPMEIEGAVGSYPLILQVATEMIGPRAVLIGDAARRVNPLAGQGLNQGFRDVAALIDTVEDASRAGLDMGAHTVLEQYSSARRFDGTGSALALDGIDRLFSNDLMLAKPVRALGLIAASKIKPLRRFLAQKASATEEGAPRSMSGW